MLFVVLSNLFKNVSDLFVEDVIDTMNKLEEYESSEEYQALERDKVRHYR